MPIVVRDSAAESPGGANVRQRDQRDQFEVTGVAERLAAYEAAAPHVFTDHDLADPELVERAATLLAVMPRNQLRETIEHLLSPDDRERGRRAVDVLIERAFAIEDETGHIRKAS